MRGAAVAVVVVLGALNVPPAHYPNIPPPAEATEGRAGEAARCSPEGAKSRECLLAPKVARLQQAHKTAQQAAGPCQGSVDALGCLDTFRRAVAEPAMSKDPKLSWPLVQLAEADKRIRAEGNFLTGTDLALLPKSLRDLAVGGLMRIDGRGQVQLFLETSGSPTEVIARVLMLGGRVERLAQSGDIVQAWLPIEQIRNMAATAASLSHIRLPDYGFPQVGAVTTEGDALLSAAAARSTHNIDGNGVRVGVVSDGVEGLGASQASGDLASVNTATCDVGPGLPTSPGAGAEGTAMLEIVHDLAPGAELWYGFDGSNFGGTVLHFIAAVNCLAQNVDIVVDDIAFFNIGPYDGTSGVSQNASQQLNNPSNRIRGYYNAVGNEATEHYQEPFVDDGIGLHRFSATSNTVDLGGFGPRSDNPVLIPGGAVAKIFLQWNDPFGASCNDYDLAAWVHNTATLIAESANPQTCTQNPTEFLALDNSLGADALVDLTIFDFAASPRTFDMFLLSTIPNFLTPCSSVPNNSDAGGGVVGLGAIDAADPGTDSIEAYSSCGPTNDGRVKPDAAAVDGVSVTGNGGFGSPFFGTSAAAPHAAGIAALLLDCRPSLTRAQLRNTLLTTAIDLGPAGSDNDFGSGRLHALDAANSAVCIQPPTPTPTRTRTPTPTPTRTPTATPTPTPKDPSGDTDGDTVPNGTDLDDDNDGCADVAELGSIAVQGGLRNPHSFWDFFDTPTGAALARDHAVTAADIAAVVGRFGSNDAGPGAFNRASDPLSTPDPAVQPSGNRQNYHPAFDRGGVLAGQNPWNLNPPDGTVSAGDLAAVVAQFGHTCV